MGSEGDAAGCCDPSVGARSASSRPPSGSDLHRWLGGSFWNMGKLPVEVGHELLQAAGTDLGIQMFG